MQQVSRPELQNQPELVYLLRNVRTVQGLFWTLAATTLGLQKAPFTWFNVGLSSWFGVSIGLFATGLQDSLVPTGKVQWDELQVKNQ